MRHREHLLLSARQGDCTLVALLGNLGEIAKRFLNAGSSLAAVHVVCSEQQIIEHRLLREHTVSFDHVHQSRFGGFARSRATKIAAVELHGSRPRQQAGDRAQQRGLAGAVGSEQRHDFAGIDGEIDATQHADLAVAR